LNFFIGISAGEKYSDFLKNGNLKHLFSDYPQKHLIHYYENKN